MCLCDWPLTFCPVDGEHSKVASALVVSGFPIAADTAPTSGWSKRLSQALETLVDTLIEDVEGAYDDDRPDDMVIYVHLLFFEVYVGLTSDSRQVLVLRANCLSSHPYFRRMVTA